MPIIDGGTCVYGIIADPVSQVRTPEAMNRIIAKRGANAVFVPFHVDAKNLGAFVEALMAWKNLPGFTVTIPHKEAAFRLCTTLGPIAEITGTVNAVRKRPDGTWEGETFDGIGFVAGLRAEAINPAGAIVRLHGAGGAAKAIGAALAHAGAARIFIANRSRDHATELVDRINSKVPGCAATFDNADFADADLVINATSLGLKPEDQLPFNPDCLGAHQIVAEVIMNPDKTNLLKQAEARGCRTHNGIHMLIHQVEAIADFLGIGPGNNLDESIA
ncbi:shikimate dehydrogenase family protein [Mesorhizobium carmichaelinearum]|uniref:shikimate dehydrogenase family protein n=1 Tax=Mesorhizobium carmichaelinearum TaxID=1208188 RepID=UPI000BA4AC37|nr:shikimate dehydrogenase [Mesorhizobium carmichaelinearum]